MEETKETTKLSYEELTKVTNDLHARCNQLYAELQNANMQNLFIRLEYLFKVVENKSAFSKDFTEACVKEIEAFMTLEKTEE